ncbi:MAG TPA: glycosyltransferase family 4 protein [Solirubrobacterales bacterium]|nr:glycosyltransferase family 4 protein [Solirubrobacterales bacterium]
MARIALVQQGDPTDPATWSGVPARLSRGIEEAGCEVVPVRATFRGAGRILQVTRMSWADQSANRLFALASGAVADRTLGRSGELDGVVMIGTGYSLRTKLPVVTYEDLTVAQALRRDEPPYNEVGSAAGRHWRARQGRIYERSRACAVTSAFAGRSVVEDYGIPAEKVRVVGVGRNVDAGRVERDWSVPRFLFVGADWRRKRGAAVVASFAEVRRRHPEATLDLVGGHPPIEAAGVTGHGLLPLGSESGERRYAELLHKATCFVMPSSLEAFGIAYMDAGATGLPSIGTTVGGAPDAVGDGGRIVDPTDDEALTRAMLELAEPETARQLGERAYRHAAPFTWRAVGERLLRALRPPGLDLAGLPEFLPGPEGRS